MNTYTLVFVGLIIIGIAFLVIPRESFYIPQNIVSYGDFHIQQSGAIADSGSFRNDMEDYHFGHGPI